MAYEAPTITEVGQFADVTLGGNHDPINLSDGGKQPWQPGGPGRH